MSLCGGVELETGAVAAAAEVRSLASVASLAVGEAGV